MDIELQFALESFQRWFSGERLTSDEITVIAMSILLCVMLIVTIALLVYLSRVTLFWTRIGWAFEDLWHWLKTRRYMRWFFDPRYSFSPVAHVSRKKTLAKRKSTKSWT